MHNVRVASSDGLGLVPPYDWLTISELCGIDWNTDDEGSEETSFQRIHSQGREAR